MNDRITKKEIAKWLSKIPELEKIYARSKKGKEWLENLKAYVSDSRYFTEKGDLVRGFEAMVWATAIWEILKDLEELKEEN